VWAGAAGSVRFDTARHARIAAKRGWTDESILDTIDNPALIRHNVNRATGNPATYYYRSDGNYVARDDVTGEIFHVSKIGDPGWIDPNTGKPIEPIAPQTGGGPADPEVPEMPIDPLIP
jgi:hypothetical protein